MPTWMCAGIKKEMVLKRKKNRVSYINSTRVKGGKENEGVRECMALHSGDRDWPRDEAGRTRGKMKHKEGSGSCFE